MSPAEWTEARVLKLHPNFKRLTLNVSYPCPVFISTPYFGKIDLHRDPVTFGVCTSGLYFRHTILFIRNCSILIVRCIAIFLLVGRKYYVENSVSIVLNAVFSLT